MLGKHCRRVQLVAVTRAHPRGMLPLKLDTEQGRAEHGGGGHHGHAAVLLHPMSYLPVMRLLHIALLLMQACACKQWMQVDWDTWYYAPGMPPVVNTYDTSLAEAAYALALRWHTGDVMGIGRFGPLEPDMGCKCRACKQVRWHKAPAIGMGESRGGL